MEENMKAPETSIRERRAEGCVCPDCGHDVQPEELYKEVAHSIAEVYWHPACPECNVYDPSYNTDHWYPEE